MSATDEQREALAALKLYPATAVAALEAEVARLVEENARLLEALEVMHDDYAEAFGEWDADVRGAKQPILDRARAVIHEHKGRTWGRVFWLVERRGSNPPEWLMIRSRESGDIKWTLRWEEAIRLDSRDVAEFLVALCGGRGAECFVSEHTTVGAP